MVYMQDIWLEDLMEIIYETWRIYRLNSSRSSLLEDWASCSSSNFLYIYFILQVRSIKTSTIGLASLYC